MKKLKQFGQACLLMAVFLLMAPKPAQAATVSDVTQQEAVINAKQSALNQELNTKMAQVSQQTIQTNQLKQSISNTQASITKAQHSLKTQKKLLKTRKKDAAKRLKAIQRQDTTQNSVFGIIASANSLTDLVQRVYAVRTMQKADALAMKNIQTTYQNLAQTKQTLQSKAQNLLTEESQLTQANQTLQQSLTELKQTMAQNQTQLAQLAQQKETLQKQATEKAAAAKQQANASANAATAQSDATGAANSASSSATNKASSAASGSGKVATGVKISFYDPAVLGSSMGYSGVAANLSVYPKGTKLKIVFADGTEIHRVVNDTGTFVYSSPNQIDVAWPNSAIPSYGITTATVTVE